MLQKCNLKLYIFNLQDIVANQKDLRSMKDNSVIENKQKDFFANMKDIQKVKDKLKDPIIMKDMEIISFKPFLANKK